MQADRVAPGEQRLEVDQLHAMVGSLLGAHVGIDGQDRHLQRDRPIRDGLPDLAETHDAQGSSAQLQARELRAFPLAAPDGRISRGDPPGQAEQQTECVLRGGDGVPGWCVDDGDPGPGRRLEIDVVDTHARAPDDDQSSPRFDEARIDLHLAPNDERLVLRYRAAQLVAGQSRSLVDLVLRTQKRHALRG